MVCANCQGTDRSPQKLDRRKNIRKIVKFCHDHVNFYRVFFSLVSPRKVWNWFRPIVKDDLSPRKVLSMETGRNKLCIKPILSLFLDVCPLESVPQSLASIYLVYIRNCSVKTQLFLAYRQNQCTWSFFHYSSSILRTFLGETSDNYPVVTVSDA